jgi:Xaa-Pro dipeptidase
MMAANLERARDLMREAGLDAIVAASPVNVRYLGGVHSWLDPLLTEAMVMPGGSDALAMRAFALLAAEGEPALVLNAGLAVNALADGAPEDVRLYGQRRIAPGRPEALAPDLRAIAERLGEAYTSPIDGLLAALRDRGLERGRIGIELRPVAAPSFVGLQDALPHAWLGDCSALLGLVRAVKTPQELELLRRAAEIGERAAFSAFATLCPGGSLADAVAHFRAAVAADGAAFDHFAAAIGGLSLTTVGDHAFAAGDCLCVDFGCISEGYFSDSAATFALGEPPTEALADYAGLLEAVDAGIGVVAPGVRASAVQARMAEVIAEHGIVCDPPTGHGLGLEVRDWPILIPDAGARITDDCVDVEFDLPLEPGMVINLEISAFRPGLAAVEVERTVVVTEDGRRDLVDQPREAIFRP